MLRKIYPSGALQILPVEKGLVFIADQGNKEDKKIVSYKHFDIATNKISLVTRKVYLLNKFGNEFEYFAEKITDYINCRVLVTGKFHFIIYPDGVIFKISRDKDSTTSKKLTLNGLGPADAVLDGDCIWCSYPESGCIIKYNSDNLTETLRIGNENSAKKGILTSPYGLFIEGRTMTVTSSEISEILYIDLDILCVKEHKEVSESVLTYAKIEEREIALTKSGIYII